MSSNWPRLEYAALTDIGAVRAENEDSLLAHEPVFMIADGVGGHDAGALASATAIAQFEPLTAHPATTIESIGSALDSARTAVQELSAVRERGAGTTLTGAVVVPYSDGFNWIILNIGDSRVYRVSRDTVQQITVDHTLRAEMIASGVPEDSPELPPGNIITRALGTPSDLPDTFKMPIVAGERILICSDGLTDTISASQLRSGLSEATVAESAHTLMAAALELRARDNVSLIVIDVLDAGRVDPETVLTEIAGAEADELEDTMDVTTA